MTDTQISVRSLSRLLATFGVNERLVRTSLTRLVNDGLLTTSTEGRRSFYRVAPQSLDLFRQADHRIYHGSADEWDGSWTIVVIDGSEATARRRAQLRQELAWAGLGSVAPNVMASPIVTAEAAAAVVGHVGGFANVLVSRSSVVEGEGTLGADELAHRVAALEEIAGRYARFIARYEDVHLRRHVAARARTGVQTAHAARRRVPSHRPVRPATAGAAAAARLDRRPRPAPGGRDLRRGRGELRSIS